MVVQIAQRMEAVYYMELPHAPTMPQHNNHKQQVEPTTCPMYVDIQNAQINAKKQLPSRDTQGRPRCFYCNNYGHVKKYCRKIVASRHHQNAQI